MTPACTACRAELPTASLLAQGGAPCPACRTTILVEIFPALLRSIGPGAPAESLLSEGEASCFFHPAKRAVLPCAACGRFLCALCDLELSGEHLCPGCLEGGARKGRLVSLDSQRTLYDRIALTVAVVPTILFYMTILTAPVAIFLSFWYWRSPGSLVRPGKHRFVLAIMIGILQIVGCGYLAYYLVTNLTKNAGGGS